MPHQNTAIRWESSAWERPRLSKGEEGQLAHGLTENGFISFFLTDSRS